MANNGIVENVSILFNTVVSTGSSASGVYLASGNGKWHSTLIFLKYVFNTGDNGTILTVLRIGFG